MTHSTLAIRLEAAIATKGLSRRELGRLSGVHANTLNNWVSGESTRPQPTQLRRVAQALGVSYEWLRTGEGPMLPPLFKNEAELEAYITGAAPGPGLAGTPKVYDPACGSGAFPALLTKALAAALSQNPTPTPEAAAKAAVEATITAQRTQKEDRIEDLVKILLS